MTKSWLNSALVALTYVAVNTEAHSWPEFINLIDSTGAIVNANQSDGYPRNWMTRNQPGWSDERVVHKILDTSSDPAICGPGPNIPGQSIPNADESKQVQNPGLPRLMANPGDLVAIRYLENGHVTQPNIPPGHAAHSGTVYVYGSQSVINPTISQMTSWSSDGKGGDGKGALLVAQPFDDAQCYQMKLTSPIFNERVKQYPNDDKELACQVNFAVPAEANVGSPYSIFWYWNWTMVANNANPKAQELYTSCMDFDIQSPSKVQSKQQKAAFDGNLPAGSRAIPAYFSSLVKMAAPTPPAPTEDLPKSDAHPMDSSSSLPRPLPEPSAGNPAVFVPTADVIKNQQSSTMPASSTPAVAATTAATATTLGGAKPTVFPLTASLPQISRTPIETDPSNSTRTKLLSTASDSTLKEQSSSFAESGGFSDVPITIVNPIVLPGPDGSVFSTIVTQIAHRASQHPVTVALTIAGAAKPSDTVVPPQDATRDRVSTLVSTTRTIAATSAKTESGPIPTPTPTPTPTPGSGSAPSPMSPLTVTTASTMPHSAVTIPSTTLQTLTTQSKSDKTRSPQTTATASLRTSQTTARTSSEIQSTSLPVSSPPSSNSTVLRLRSRQRSARDLFVGI